jgi:hypothetical protein
LNYELVELIYVTTDGQSASLSWCQAPIMGLRPDIYYCQTAVGLLILGPSLWRENGSAFSIHSGPRQRSHSWVRVPWVPRGPGPRISIPQEQGGKVIPPGTGFPFRRPLRLAELLWRYSNPPPHGVNYQLFWELRSVAAARTP